LDLEDARRTRASQASISPRTLRLISPDSAFFETWTSYRLVKNSCIPALKELEEWFDAQKEIRGIAKLDPFFERTSKLASRRLKREIERRGTLGEFALEPDPLHLKRIPSKESGSDLFRSDGPDAVGRSGEVESPQSVVQGCPVQGGAAGPGEKES
jgi:hypothetical protein